MTRQSVLFLHIWTLLPFLKCAKQLRRASYQVKFWCVSCRLVRGRGKANRSYLQLYVFDGGGFMCVFCFFLWFFFLGCSFILGFCFFLYFSERRPWKGLKISLNILWQEWVYWWWPKSYYCPVTCSPQEQFCVLSAVEICLVMLWNSGLPKLCSAHQSY